MSFSPGASLRAAAFAGIGFAVLTLAGCGQSNITQTTTSTTTSASASPGATKAAGQVLFESSGFSHALATAVPPDKVQLSPDSALTQQLMARRSVMSMAEQNIIQTYPDAAQFWLKGDSFTRAHVTPLVTVKTNKGSFVIEIEPRGVEITAGNFVSLVQRHFYDHLTFHRYVPGFVIQGGDPKGDGTGGPDYTIPDEAGPLLHDTGAVAMAKSGANTAGSQFYITLAPAHQLDHKYTVFGKVIKGMDVVDKLRQGDVMEKVTVSDLPPNDHGPVVPKLAPALKRKTLMPPGLANSSLKPRVNRVQ